METTTAPKIVGPKDGKAGFLGSIGVRFMIDGVEAGDRFSLNSDLERFSPRDPSNHLDGLWQYLYPSRPTT